MSRDVEAVRTFLRTSKKFCFHDQWLVDCIDWIRGSFGQEVSGLASLRQKVCEQWLLGDLREISPGCLPGVVVQSQVGLLSGTYSLQVNHAVDVGVSAYSQLEKLKGKEVIEEEQNQDKGSKKATWEEKIKPSRLLMFELTDGATTVKAMEHHPIPSLSTAIAPGCKVTVSGDIQIRRGVLLLNQGNVSFLGGQVDSLVAEMTQQKVLSNALGLEDAPQQSEGGAVQPGPTHGSGTTTGPPQPGSREGTTVRHNGVGSATISGVSEADLAMEQQIAEELEDLAEQVAINDNTAVPAGRTQPRSPSKKKVSTKKPMAISTSSSAAAATSGGGQPVVLSLRERLSRRPEPTKEIASSLSGTVEDDDELALAVLAAQEADRLEKADKPPVTQRRPSRFTDKPPPPVNTERDAYCPTTAQPRRLASHSTAPQATLQQQKKRPGTNTTKTTGAVSSMSNSATTVASSRAASAVAVAQSAQASSSSAARHVTSTPPPAKRSCPTVEDSPVDPPFTYLKVINRNMPSFANKTVWIKAFLGTLTSKLRSGDGWCVRAIINDGSDAMEVEFGNKVLVELIGFTTLEQKALYAQAKTTGNPAIKSRVLELSLDREFPTVVSMREPNCRDAEVLLTSVRAHLV